MSGDCLETDGRSRRALRPTGQRRRGRLLAKRFNMERELGACSTRSPTRRCWVSIMSRSELGLGARWIVIMVVVRDIMIVSPVIVSWLFGKPIRWKPLMCAKAHTVETGGVRGLLMGCARIRIPAPKTYGT